LPSRRLESARSFSITSQGSRPASPNLYTRRQPEGVHESPPATEQCAPQL
jgi:hypothetical protein